MICNLTLSYTAIRNIRQELQKVVRKQKLEFAAISGTAGMCTACGVKCNDLFCDSCFNSLHPSTPTFKTSELVSFYVQIQDEESLDQLRKHLSFLESFVATSDTERRFICNFRRRLRQKLYMALQRTRSRVKLALLDEQYKRMKLEYLLKVKKKNVSEALMLKDFLIDLKEAIKKISEDLA